ncbi:hypothetical protein [Streptomyces sp. NPDC001933]|uniref:hypothetical protein n=1 Tax=Streptomyces sp. NPDC001933 TaxID=3364626 RepID=UPI003699559D
MAHADAHPWTREPGRPLPSAGHPRDPLPRLAPQQPPPSTDLPVLRGEDTVLVRPYLVAHERRVKALQPVRRTLHVAPHGVRTEGWRWAE